MTTAILGADTLTPDRDRATRYLAEYLRDNLNADFAAIASTMPPELGDRAIVSIRDFNSFNFTGDEFPALAVYRTGSKGEAFGESSAIAAYYLPSMAAQEQQPGIMRWVEVRIIRALERRGMAFDDDQPVVTDLSQSRSEYQIGLLPGLGTPFPYLKVFFDFTEIGA
jgi:hypothetical protein